MYIPSYEQLLSVSAKKLASQPHMASVTIPKKLFEFLLQLALSSAEFDEEGYLSENPDIRQGLANGNPLTAQQHYVGYGYFEGRRGGIVKVDEKWYRKTYPDVAAAISAGEVASANEHFHMIGAAEGRAPSAAYQEEAKQWKTMLGPL